MRTTRIRNSKLARKPICVKKFHRIATVLFFYNIDFSCIEWIENHGTAACNMCERWTQNQWILCIVALPS
ncbi:unnamed protein product [Sphagnum jensenii]|uniref:Uncharacterized protein n=1 Tax=Sphagnum jensenii TaxID=128206 RepID=A0ABP1ALQ0_9BRYO